MNAPKRPFRSTVNEALQMLEVMSYGMAPEERGKLKHVAVGLGIVLALLSIATILGLVDIVHFLVSHL